MQVKIKGSEANTLLTPLYCRNVTGTDLGYECSVLSLLGREGLRTDEGYHFVPTP